MEFLTAISFIFFVAAIMVNIVCAENHMKAYNRYVKLAEDYEKLCIGRMRAFWKILGAYPTENGDMRLDTEGLTLTIHDGKIKDWYAEL